MRILADANEDALTSGRRPRHRMRIPMHEPLGVEALSRPAQRKLPQGRQISRREIMFERPLGLLRHVDLAFAKALHQLIGREVDDFDVVGSVEDGIRRRFANPDAGDLLNDIVEAFDMLDVQRGVNVDPGGEQLLDIEIALGVAAAGRVGMGKLVDKRELGPAREKGVEVHLVQAAALVVDMFSRNDLQAGQQGFGLRPAMRFDDAGDDVGSGAGARARGRQHFIGLADARRSAEENLQMAAACLFAARQVEQGIGRWTVGFLGLGHGRTLRGRRGQVLDIPQLSGGAPGL